MSEKWLQEETYKALLIYGNNIIRSPVLLNGGAILALLTFLGHFLGGKQNVSVDMTWAMACFITGLLLGCCANVMAYLTQLSAFNVRMKSEENFERFAPTMNPRAGFYFTLGFVIVGLILFGIGSFSALIELQSYT